MLYVNVKASKNLEKVQDFELKSDLLEFFHFQVYHQSNHPAEKLKQ